MPLSVLAQEGWVVVLLQNEYMYITRDLMDSVQKSKDF